MRVVIGKYIFIGLLGVLAFAQALGAGQNSKVVYGKTMCDDAVSSYLLNIYPLEASRRQAVLTEFNRLVSTYLAPTDWKAPLGINDLSNKKAIADRRYFIDNIFAFGESTVLGPIAKEAFAQLPDPKYRQLGESQNLYSFFSFVHFIDFNNYQYFFCKNQRIYASLRKVHLEGDNVERGIEGLKKQGQRVIQQVTDETGLMTLLVEKNGVYSYLKIRGNEYYQFTFEPSFAAQNDGRLSIEMLK